MNLEAHETSSSNAWPNNARSNNARSNNTKPANGYAMWACVALFFFYQYILRVSPGVMVNELRFDYGITAEQFSYFGAFNLYAYALLQIPVGLLVDKYGVKRIVSLSIVICILATILSAMTHNLYLAYFSRFLMGVGSACSFMCTLKIVVDYLPKNKNGLWMGITLALGVAGALVAGKPLSVAMDLYGWRHALLLTVILGMLILLSVMLIFPRSVSDARGLKANGDVSTDKRGDKNLNKKGSANEIFRSILEILSTRMVLIYAFLAVGLYTPLSVMADLWGVAYIMAKFGLVRSDAAQVSMMLYVGLCAGSLVLPTLAEKYNALNKTITFCVFGILLSLCTILFTPNLGWIEISILLFTLGFFCGAETLCFTGVVIYAPLNKTGVTIGITNTANMLGAAIAQQVIGIILDRVLWAGAMDVNGHRLYNVSDYTIALSSLIFIIGLCCVLAYQLPKKNC